MFRSDAQDRSVLLKVKACDASVRTEPIEFMRAITNLVSNALRHSGATKVLLATQERSECVIVRVIDNGEGFDPDSSRPGINSGTGLGLTQVKEFAGRPGHAVRIQSAAKQGSCVSLHIPRA